LTGAFGAHFNWQNAAAVGMIPLKAVAGEVFSAANLAGVGAMPALLDKNKRLEAETIASNAEFIELAMAPGLNELFVAGTSFSDILL
jgi:uncharacterized 2Fe-2S/4Fe-4S cluster protein (DUF4445 family)